MIINDKASDFPDEGNQDDTGDRLKSDLPAWIIINDHKSLSASTIDKTSDEKTAKLNINKNDKETSQWKQENSNVSEFPTQPIQTRIFSEGDLDKEFEIIADKEINVPEITNKSIEVYDESQVDSAFQINQANRAPELETPNSLNGSIDIDLTHSEDQNIDAIPDWLLQLAKTNERKDSSELPLSTESDKDSVNNEDGLNN